MCAKRIKRSLIIDGYNVIYASDKYKKLINESPGVSDIYVMARQALIADVAAAAQNHYEAVIVFDGAQNKFSDGKPQKVAGISVIFSPYKMEADQVIEKLAKEARAQEHEVIVVSSDQAMQWTVVGDRITRLSSRMFEEEVESMNTYLKEDAQDYSKATIGDRLDPEVYAKLKAMSQKRVSDK